MSLYAAVRSREKDLQGYILECLKSMGESLMLIVYLLWQNISTSQ